MSHRCCASVFFALFAFWAAGPAMGQVTITHAKAMNGNVTPEDTAGYPVTLSRPGSYVLGSNLSPGADASSAIHAAAPDITIDLNGFVISGGPAGGGANALDGIYGTSNRLRVRNGIVGAFRRAGIYMERQSYLVVEDMEILNGSRGVYNPLGSFTRVHGATVATNTGQGIACGNYCLVQNSIVSGNGSTGVSCNAGCQVESSIVSGNYDGIYVSGGAVLGNTIQNNRGRGVVAAELNGVVGLGNNTIVANGKQVAGVGRFRLMQPNACLPECFN